ncbi:MAG: MtrB/PioB family outer membrane beta-barrel protein [Deltaproteobacteria bacterium]|nr:MtrB/PioB family outer membrane beta-barrel protein [Candidatus Anaeroferrophillacea bacterium]
MFFFILVALPAAVPVSAAEGDGKDEVKVFGNITAGWRMFEDVDGDDALFEEYRDLDDDLFGTVDLEVYRGSLDLYLQTTRLRGRDWGKYSFELFYDETPHNLSDDARSPWSGIGSAAPVLEGTTIPPLSSWSSFDYDVDRDEFGGRVSLFFATPFYVTFGIQRRSQEGIRPLGSGDYFLNLELPEPVDYTTDDLSLQGGYRGNTFQAQVTGSWSRFDNDDRFMTRPGAAAGDVMTLPPDNDYGKVAADLSWRELPLQSVLAVRLSYARLESDFSVADLGLTDVSDLDRTTFDGEIDYTRGAVALSSRLTDTLDSRIHYSFLDRDNDSTPVSASHAERIFDYREHRAGIDLGYDFARHTRLAGGYAFRDLDRRNLLEAEESTDHSVFIEVRNSSLEFFCARLRYERLDRDADFGNRGRGTDPVADSGEWIKRYIRHYYATDKSMDEVRMVLEFYPVDRFDLGFEYAYKLNDYDETDIGLTGDERHEFYADFAWRAAERITFGGFAGYELTNADSRHRQFGVGESAEITDDTGGAFNWGSERDEDYRTCGLSLDVREFLGKLALHLAWQYQDSDGEVHFASATGGLEDIDRSDDYDRHKLEARLTWACRDDTTVTLSYLYDRYDYDDLRFDDYEAYLPAGGVSGSYLTGAYDDRSYEANVGYLAVSYRF